MNYPTMILPTSIGPVHVSWLGDDVVRLSNLSAAGGKGYWTVEEEKCSGVLMFDITYPPEQAYPSLRPRFPLSLRHWLSGEEYGDPVARLTVVGVLEAEVTRCVLANPELGMQATVKHCHCLLEDAQLVYEELVEARKEAFRKIQSLTQRANLAGRVLLEWLGRRTKGPERES